jgi:uncharacterized protein
MCCWWSGGNWINDVCIEQRRGAWYAFFMRPSENLKRHRELVLSIASKHRTENLRMFGSIARGEDTETSDIDLLDDPLHGTTLLNLIGLEQELTQLLSAKVDLLTPDGLSKYIRDDVLREARVL